MGQPPTQHIEHDLFADVADVGGGLDGEPAVIDRHLALDDRIERARGAGGRIIELERHRPSLAALTTDFSAVINRSTSVSSE